MSFRKTGNSAQISAGNWNKWPIDHCRNILMICTYTQTLPFAQIFCYCSFQKLVKQAQKRKHSERREKEERSQFEMGLESTGFLPDCFPQAHLQILKYLDGDPSFISTCLQPVPDVCPWKMDVRPCFHLALASSSWNRKDANISSPILLTLTLPLKKIQTHTWYTENFPFPFFLFSSAFLLCTFLEVNQVENCSQSWLPGKQVQFHLDILQT